MCYRIGVPCWIAPTIFAAEKFGLVNVNCSARQARPIENLFNVRSLDAAFPMA